MSFYSDITSSIGPAVVDSFLTLDQVKPQTETLPYQLIARDQVKSQTGALPYELMARSIAFTGDPHTSKYVSKEWYFSSLDSFQETLESYSTNPKIWLIASQFMPAGNAKPTAAECVLIVENTRRVILDSAAAVSLNVPNPTKVNLVTLLEQIEERKNASLVTFFNRLCSEISETERPLIEGNLPEKAATIRAWMRDNQAILNRIVDLDLSNLQLDALPPEVGLLKRLHLLTLTNNRLSTLPAAIGLLKHLRVLTLSYNRITSLPATINQLRQLRALHLDHNRITSLPATIGQLRRLSELRLDYNRITSLPATFVQLGNLKGLYCNNNRFSTFPQEICQLAHLRILQLNHNQITAVPAAIDQLVELRTLYLMGNLLTTLPIEMTRLPLLQNLFLDNNPLATTQQVTISQLVNRMGQLIQSAIFNWYQPG